ncbi:MAG: class I SAM-dependent methyltransferase [Anaerolineae bacterium]
MDALREFFDRLADEWDAQQSPEREENLRRLLAPFHVLLRSAQTVLEIGTGTGALIPLIREAAPAARVISVDLSYRMLQHARARCPDASLLQADAHHLPFLPTTFDLALCHNVFPHFRDKPAALAELARVMGDGSRLLILHDLGREQVNAIHRGVGGAIGDDRLPPNQELHYLLLQAGFVGVEVEDTPERYWAIGRRTVLL